MVAVLSAAGLVDALWRPADRSFTPLPLPLPAASAIGPGIGITVEYTDGTGSERCTAGFLVRTRAGRPALLTAGHCNGPGGAGRVVTTDAGTGSTETVGAVADSVFQGNAWDDGDIALIALDNHASIPLTSDIVGGPAVSGVRSTVAVDDQLCKVGIGTGKRECGPVVLVRGNKVAFAAPTACGDSGGPVYALQPDGSAAAVGVLVAGTNAEPAAPGCAGAAKFSVAELIEPWLDKWQLSAVTTVAAPTSAPAGPRATRSGRAPFSSRR
jgi:hypothetical protein